jgi:hypothetical protein
MKYLLFGLYGVLLVGCGAQQEALGEFDCRAPDNDGVRFVEPLDGAAVPASFSAVMSAGELEVQPAGTMTPGTGHMHILVDAQLLGAGEVIPGDEQHRHYGDGSLTAALELPPGEHVLRLQFADGAHRAYAGAGCHDEIRVSVEETARP